MTQRGVFFVKKLVAKNRQLGCKIDVYLSNILYTPLKSSVFRIQTNVTSDLDLWIIGYFLVLGRNESPSSKKIFRRKALQSFCLVWRMKYQLPSAMAVIDRKLLKI